MIVGDGEVIFFGTASGSTYTIDTFDGWTLARHPREPYEPVTEWPSAALRRDGEAVPLLKVYEFEEGKPAVFLVQVADDPDITTVRTTTPVTAIWRT